MAIAPADFTPEFAAPSTPQFDRAHSFWSRLLRHRLAQAGLGIVVLLVLVACLARLISPLDPMHSLPSGVSELGQPHAPGGGFLLGADTLGRDVWTRTLYGTRISLLVGVCAMITAVTFGTTVGLVSGYFGGSVDVILTRLTETIISLPTILLAITLTAVLPTEPIPLGPWSLDRHLVNLLLAISLVTWTGIARAVRGQVLSLKEQEFVEAARAVGCSHARILAVHLLPNVLPTVTVLATLAMSSNILLEAGLSFLGQGVEPGTPSWGAMIGDGQPYIVTAPWIVLAPGVAIVIAVAGFNMLGQALQEVLEPRA